jgi:predicted hydrocarbon binding protein
MSTHAEHPPLDPAVAGADSAAASGGHSPLREIQVPSGLLEDLHSLAGTDVLEAAGRRAGVWLGAAMSEALGSDALGHAPTGAFWEALDEVLRSRGWGRLRQERVHSGLAVVVAEDWMEKGGAASPGCPFTVGLLEALFEQVAGEPITVLETACEGHGDEVCRFVFGSGAAVSELRSRLDGGVSEEAALAGF